MGNESEDLLYTAVLFVFYPYQGRLFNFQREQSN